MTEFFLFTKDYFIKLISVTRGQFRPISSDYLGMETGIDIFIISFPGAPRSGQRLRINDWNKE
jgi:hypothetical protein